MSDAEDLPDEFELTRLAPLAAEQIYHLSRAINRPELANRSDAGQVWECVAHHVAANCPEQPRADAVLLRELVTRHADLFRTHVHKYSLWAQVFPDAWLTFMNYGYHPFDRPDDLGLVGAELGWARAAAMYHHVATQVDLRGKDVLEIGCGRGGGAAYVARRLAPRTLTATDGTRSNVSFCRRVHRDGGERLRFLHARAEDLPGADDSVDVVLNVESCKYYEPFAAFAAGVHRVLRPGGHLLIAFYDGLDGALAIRRGLAGAGFQPTREEDISANVLAALAPFREHDLIANIERNPTVRAKRHYHEFLDGAYRFEALTSGRCRYYCAAWRKDG